jgi:hypothetical protein
MAQTHDLAGLLGELERAAQENGPKVTVNDVMDCIGHRSFGPLLLVAGLLGMTPVAAVPGAPTILAMITLLVASQLLIGRDTFWLPKFLKERSVKADKLEKALRIAEKPARVVDRLVKPRLEVLTSGIADRFVAAACVIVALATPPLEFLPFVAFFPSLAIFTFGLGLLARDGLLVAIAFLISGSALGFGLYHLLT